MIFQSNEKIFMYICLIIKVNHKNKSQKKQPNKIIYNKKYNCSGPPAFKSQRVGTRNYCIIVSIQIICSIHTLILKIHQILESRELKDHCHLWIGPPKNHWINFYLSWICTCKQKNSMLETANFRVRWPDWPHRFLPMPINMQKISLFHLPILQIQSIKSHNMTGHTQFWPCQPLKLSN